jgi:hypothetical protein
VCFSAQADLIGGVGVTLLGVDCLRHQRHGREIVLASLPVLLGAHQLVESFVWFGLQGHVPAGLGRVATWAYLVVAFVVLPVLVPLAVLIIEPSRRRRLLMAPFVGAGAVVTAVLLAAMLRGPLTAELRNYHIAYGVDLRYGAAIVTTYVAATCVPLLLSNHRPMVAFGVVNLAVVIVLAVFQREGFASLWCAWAAVASGALAIDLRLGRRPARGDFRLLS